MKANVARKSSDATGKRWIWWYDNGWRIVRTPPDRSETGRYSYTIETSSHFPPYKWAGTVPSLKSARTLLKMQERV